MPGVLISVRNVDEAIVAARAGAAIVDLKEPSRGSLGPVDLATVLAVRAALPGTVALSVACGELAESTVERLLPPSGCNFAKLGLAGMAGDPRDGRSTWQARWQACLAMWPANVQRVAVCYADWQQVAAPRPQEILDAAVELGCSVLLIDTALKTGGNVFDHCSVEDLTDFGHRVRIAKLRFVLAGSLNSQHLRQIQAIQPDLVALRGAVCQGNRNGPLDPLAASEWCEAMAEW